MVEKVVCEVCGLYFYRNENKNRNLKYRDSKKCPSCRGKISRWTKKEIEKLIFLRKNTSESLSVIAQKVGRTREACSNKLTKMRVRKSFLGEFRRATCVLCGDEYGRYTTSWALKLENKFICGECREMFGKTKKIDDVIFIAINKDLYYPLHYLIWLLGGHSLTYKGILTHKGEKNNNNIENLIITSIK